MFPRSSFGPRRHPGFFASTVRRDACAFTVTELLVILGLVAVLCVVLFPGIKRAREQAQAAECAVKLRWIGNELLTYATEHQGWVKVSAANRWYTYLPGVVSTLKAPGVAWATADFRKIGCLTGKPPTISHTYGLLLNTQTHDGLSRMEEVNIGGSIFREWSDRILLRPQPGSYPFLADTAISDGNQGSYFYTRKDGEGWSRLCARHSGKVNVWFADGHLEACDEARLRALNVLYVRDNEGREKKF